VIEPAVVDFRYAISGTEDQIDEVFSAVPIRLAEPVRKGQLTPIASLLERRRGAIEIVLPDEYIEVFGVPFDAGVAGIGIRTADEMRNLRVAQNRQ
jgi:hypothetical protein